MSKSLAPQINDASFLDYAKEHGFGELHITIDPKTGMQCIIAIHSTKLGPALGGCRFIEYHNPNLALYDAMRLARGMSYKAASVDLPLGGGKAVILKPQTSYDREAYFKYFGQFVDSLGGKYITAMDSGTEIYDMDTIREHTPYVSTCSALKGDPSPSTVQGILRGIQAASNYKLKNPNLEGLHIAIQGLGHVGFGLATRLHEMGVKLTVSDINNEAVNRAKSLLNVDVVSTHEIHAIDCDIFAPCALGGILNDETIPEIRASIIAGGANNQLAHAYHGKTLHDRGILYAPDYIINAGGLIFAAYNYLNQNDEIITQTLNEKIENIYTSLSEVFDRATHENIPTSEIADTLAQEKLDD